VHTGVRFEILKEEDHFGDLGCTWEERICRILRDKSCGCQLGSLGSGQGSGPGSYVRGSELLLLSKVPSFLSGWKTGAFSRRALLHSTNVSKNVITSILRVEEYTEQDASVNTSASTALNECCVLNYLDLN
jgi:hypothetical protein